MPWDLSPLWISLKVVAVATLLSFGLGLTMAYRMVHTQGRWRSLIDGLCIAPLILPPTVVGFVLLQLLGRRGLVGRLLQQLQVDLIFTWYAGAIAAAVVTFPLMYRTALAAFEQIDGNLLQVARTLGVSEWRIFWHLSLPLALPGILAGTTLAFARGLGEFGATLMLAGNIPGVTTTIPLAIFAAVEAGDTAEAWFWSAVILSISLSAIALTNLWVAQRQRHSQNFRLVLRRPPVRRPTALRHYPPPAPPSAATGLVVDLHKTLPDYDLRVQFQGDRQTLGILGASGAGKSVLLRCIAGIDTPDAGLIMLNGRVLFDARRGINVPSRDRHIGLLFQNYALFPHLTVAQNIVFGERDRPSHLAPRIAAQLAALGLKGVGDRYPHQLSGGQQQRVALARALIRQPQLLLLDEPFSALDTHLRSQMEQELSATLENYDGTSLLVTHNLEEAYRLCQNLLILDAGRAIATGSKHQIFEQPQTVSVARLTGCKNFSAAQPQTPQTLFAPDWNCTLTTLESRPPDLAQVGFRAHQIQFLPATALPRHRPNTFPAWLAATSETPHRMTLYLTLHRPATHPGDYHLQAEVFKEKWAQIKDQPLPWLIYLDPLKLMLLSDPQDESV